MLRLNLIGWLVAALETAETTADVALVSRALTWYEP
jgi:hypothetical protein